MEFIFAFKRGSNYASSRGPFPSNRRPGIKPADKAKPREKGGEVFGASYPGRQGSFALGYFRIVPPGLRSGSLSSHRALRKPAGVRRRRFWAKMRLGYAHSVETNYATASAMDGTIA
ncbi:hypothetical protein SBV1_640009 [Verrucomicrobia bacterium]|nr:hypothetical protein SBV1_640009 [Verrucomicrobiota bacterium]